MTFSDFNEVVPKLYIGSHPEPEDPFVMGANVLFLSRPTRLPARYHATVR